MEAPPHSKHVLFGAGGLGQRQMDLLVLLLTEVACQVSAQVRRGRDVRQPRWATSCCTDHLAAAAGACGLHAAKR